MKNPKLRILLLTLAAGVLAAGCDADYDFGKTGATSHVVVNALLSPQEDFTVKLNWSTAYAGDDTQFPPVDEAEIRLLEEGAEVGRPRPTYRRCLRWKWLSATTRTPTNTMR